MIRREDADGPTYGMFCPQLPRQEFDDPTPPTNPIDEIYDRLAKVDLPKCYLKRYALPIGWSSDFESEPSAKSLFVAHVSRFTGHPAAALLTPGQALEANPINTFERRQVIMRDRHAAGEDIEDLMLDYGLSEEEVEIILGLVFNIIPCGA